MEHTEKGPCAEPAWVSLSKQSEWSFEHEQSGRNSGISEIFLTRLSQVARSSETERGRCVDRGGEGKVTRVVPDGGNREANLR